MDAQIVPPAVCGRGAYCFRIHGQIYHRTSHLHPAQAEEKFVQLYVLDPELTTCRRMERCENSECNPELMRRIDEVIRRVNPFAAAYTMMWELEQQVLHEEGHEASESVTVYISDERLDSDQHRGRYNAPKTNEVAMVFKSSDGVPPNNRDICIYPKQRQLCRISTLNPNSDPMTYVSFFPCGEKGFRVNQCFTELQFYVHRLSVRRDIFNPILYGGKHMQQYVVDFYLKVEGNRLNFIRHNQRTLRVESYLGLADHVNVLATEAGMRACVTLILSSSFIGSSRAMQQNFQDATSVVRDFGKPDLFLTYTCNPKWKDIKDNPFPEQKPHDRPDLVARIFDIKKALLQDLKKNGIFGRIAADIYVIEFQKRGVPHMHLLLILAEEDKIRDPESIESQQNCRTRQRILNCMKL
ncbi:helitron_like_N domain-containing protein [Trichonephila clavipes]|uniref:Helitron_like_N domain-containing protein n=1 Tax=Trichonephila clavipes TaxID=2585209 RepID=A0A8X6V0M4_TRICX|nr:helitron_like_N domain-containing protein [Trichonephila clavipes]